MSTIEPKERLLMAYPHEVEAILNSSCGEIVRAVKPSVTGCSVGSYEDGGRTVPANTTKDGERWTDIECPYGAVGDKLWISAPGYDTGVPGCNYDGHFLFNMLLWNNRIVLEVTDIIASQNSHGVLWVVGFKRVRPGVEASRD